MKTHPAHYVGASNYDRDIADFYPTPKKASIPLFEVETFPNKIWEPACGDGSLSKVAIEFGYDVESQDLYDYGYGKSGIDFFTSTVPIGCKSLVTNPPYQIKHPTGTLRVEDWIEKAWKFEQIEKMALLLKTTAIAGKKRSHILEQSNLKYVLQFRGRIDLHKNGIKVKGKSNNMIDFAWFVFERGYTDYPMIKYIEAKEWN